MIKRSGRVSDCRTRGILDCVLDDATEYPWGYPAASPTTRRDCRRVPGPSSTAAPRMVEDTAGSRRRRRGACADMPGALAARERGMSGDTRRPRRRGARVCPGMLRRLSVPCGVALPRRRGATPSAGCLAGDASLSEALVGLAFGATVSASARSTATLPGGRLALVGGGAVEELRDLRQPFVRGILLQHLLDQP